MIPSLVLDAWPVFVIVGFPLLANLILHLAERIRDRRAEAEIARAMSTAGPVSAIFVYTRADWLRDMADPELTIDEITARVVRSNGGWRIPPRPPLKTKCPLPCCATDHEYNPECLCLPCQAEYRLRKRAMKVLRLSTIGSLIGGLAAIAAGPALGLLPRVLDDDE